MANRIGPDYGRLKTTNVNSKTHISNPALYQTIDGLIDGVKRFQEFTTQNFSSLSETVQGSFASISGTLTELTNQIIAIRELIPQITINLIPIDTSGGAVGLNLSDLPVGYNLIKDMTGNASTNNITLTGTIESVVNPIINVDFGFMRVFAFEGNYFNW